MKLQTTKKNMYSVYGGNNIYKVGYCDLQYLLTYEQATGYIASNSYGWRCDLYDLDGVIISTGYAPIGEKQVDYKLARKYDAEAQKIIYNSKTPREDVQKLLKQFINEIKENDA